MLDSQLIDMLKGFGSSAPVIVLLYVLLQRKEKELVAKDALLEKRTDQLLAILPKAIEAENEMSTALTLLSGRIK